MKRREFLSVIGVSAMPVIAGCQSGESSSTKNETTAKSPTTSPTDTTESPTTSPSDTTENTATVSGEDFDLPKGFSVDGVEDGEKVLEGHISSLQDMTYTILFEQKMQSPTNFVEKMDRKNTHGFVHEKKTGAEWYFDKNHLYYNNPEKNRSNTSSIDESTVKSLFAGQMDYRIFSMLPQYQYSDPTFEVIDGHQVAQFQIENENSGKVTVMPSGTVKEILVENSDGLLFNYEIVKIGTTTVEKPGWVEEVQTTSN